MYVGVKDAPEARILIVARRRIRYYDPVIDHHHAPNAAMGLGVAWYTLPQNPQYARELYAAAMAELGWVDPDRPLTPTRPGSYRSVILALLLATEFGDNRVAARLRRDLEPIAEPKNFGAGEAEAQYFGYFFHLQEKWPRGQLNALLVVADIVQGPGEWSGVFNNPHHADRFQQPTVSGVDFPAMGLSVAEYSERDRTLAIESYCGVPASRGHPTAFTVTMLPPGEITVTLGGDPFVDWAPAGDGAITINTTIGDHVFAVKTASPARL